MSRKIIGITVGSPLPKSNLMQTDPTKGDYVKGREEFLQDPSLKGEPGTSVTVTNVSESTADGGTNVVTFSDGKKLNVKNGNKGAGVQSMTYNSSTNKWTVTLTDGSSITVDGPAIPDVSGYMPKSGGTFTGSVQVGTASTDGYYARNFKFSDTAETPTTEGDVCFKLK